MNKIIKYKYLLLFFLTVLITSCKQSSNPASPATPPHSLYSVTRSSNNLDYNFYYNNHHFMSLLTAGGIIALRPHPGIDTNGWGSTWYSQPFLAGAELKNTTINKAEVDSKGTSITIEAIGKVSYGISSDYGTWSLTITIIYDQLNKIIAGNGSYTISLSKKLDSVTGDLNLYKIASNYLDDVPLLSGGIGDTGDMELVVINGNGNSYPLTWRPTDGNYFPNIFTDFMSIDVSGQYNNVDTKAQGYAKIEPAYKPSIKVILNSKQIGIPMIFGGIYISNKSKDFWEDNVGITPLILKQSILTDYQFDLQFESKAMSGDK